MTGRFGEGDFLNRDKITRQDKGLFIWEEGLCLAKAVANAMKRLLCRAKNFWKLIIPKLWMNLFFLLFFYSSGSGWLLLYGKNDKQTTNCFELRRDVFHPGIKYLSEKYCPGIRDRGRVTGSRQARTKWKNFPALYKHDKKSKKKLL